MDKQEILKILKAEETHSLFSTADRIRKEECGEDVFVRGIIEFSSSCIRNCLYCGLRKDNVQLERYRMSRQEILNTVDEIAARGLRTVVLQSGDDFTYTKDMVCGMILSIKEKHPEMAVTLSLGERTREELKAFKECGADRYLIKFEATHAELYKKLHPGQSVEQRIEIAYYLRALGYQVGLGNIVGLPFQTLEHLAGDILFMQEFQPDMAGIGPFVAQRDTPLADYPAGGLALTLKVLSLTRIVSPRTHLPATTAIASIDTQNGQLSALRSGANVVMVNFTPLQYGECYQIYDNKAKTSLELAEKNIIQAGRRLCLEKGDSLIAAERAV